MYYQFQFSKNLPAVPDAERFQWFLVVGNWLMIIGLLGTFLTIEVCYVFDDYFSLGVQIAGHISMLLFAVAVKFGYIMRCISMKGFGEEM